MVILIGGGPDMKRFPSIVNLAFLYGAGHG